VARVGFREPRRETETRHHRLLHLVRPEDRVLERVVPLGPAGRLDPVEDEPPGTGGGFVERLDAERRTEVKRNALS